ncbi:MAG: TrmH family RNA methyltransferase [Catenisphaera adipataccumulans]|jgi:TrmH family RNA methyltransferase|uniref:TrmH family RNA methyltransferase n=1 Tax=Catenisphaera adipataccumulans TaxID=700500 RepID=UPI003D9045FD
MIITSVQNQKIKMRAKLHLHKERIRQQCFAVEGRHMVEEADQAGCLQELYIAEGIPNDFSIEPVFCSPAVMKKLSHRQSAADMIGICRFPVLHPKNEKTVVFLQDVQDPGNVGTLIRSAYSFGIDALYLSAGCADPYNPKTLQASQGAIFHLPCIVCDLPAVMAQKQHSGMTLYATALHHRSQALQAIKPKHPCGIVLGNEGQGLPDELIEQCDATVKIEMTAFESLNVAVAGSLMMYEFQYKK